MWFLLQNKNNDWIKKMTEKEKAMQGLLFRQGDPELKKQRDRAAALCFKYNHTSPEDAETKRNIIDQLISDHKEKIIINAPFYCDYGDYITVGDRFFANYDTKILDGGKVTFGDDVRIGPGCTFITVTHTLDPELRKQGYQIFRPITVGNNVWFGANCTILPGVSIGDNAVIAAGSVVNRDIPADSMAAGVPCTIKKTL